MVKRAPGVNTPLGAGLILETFTSGAGHIGAMKKTISITVRPNGTTLIEGYPERFPVDGDALVRGKEQDRRGQDVISGDEALMSAARDWLGIARFVVYASYVRKAAAAA